MKYVPLIIVIYFIFGSLNLFPEMGKAEEKLVPGIVFPVIEYENQFGKRVALPDDTRFIIFSRDKESGKMGRETIVSLGGKEFMTRKKAIFIADISGAPSLIRSLFVIPSLREFSFSVYLILDEEASKPIPSREKMVTIIELKNKAIVNLSFAKDNQEISSFLSQE